MEENGIPGMIVSVTTPKQGSWKVALGMSDVGKKTPMRIDDHVRAGSITKTMTGTVVLQLAEEGKVDLDDPLSKYVPEVDTNQATVRQTLQMVSGIPDYTTLPFLNDLALQPARVWSPAELVDLIAGRPATFPAGQGWEYSNPNFVLLALLAQNVTGQAYEELIDQRIFSPLKMSGCSMPAATDATMPSPYSRGYQLSTIWDRQPTPPAPLPDLVDVTDNNPSWGFGTGQLICRASDLETWAQALEEPLTPRMQAQRLDWYTIQDGSGTRDSVKAQYGLGINKLNDLVGHNGEISGYQSQATRRETDGTIIVVLSNLMITPSLQEPATVLSELIAEVIPV